MMVNQRGTSKTANSDLAAKLTLRRHFLDRYHGRRPPHVLDCCQGAGVIWGTLRRTYQLASYVGVDTKPRRGRLAIDSVRLLDQPGWQYDVIDVDTYGSPWRHWLALLPHVRRPVTVFLTWGSVGYGAAPDVALELLGLGFRRLELPMTLAAKAYARGLPWLLGAAYGHGLEIAALEAHSRVGHARYIGVHLAPAGRGL